ncbi:hypothetical protein HMPREF1987_01609 [Peptostreptococcaceae bacterium oral taxon 113 str. W5053]|nr:hypothetical protein HMPREF1987_01609 [Peptostreptococcaceae bacterium oral taxon 113 str. W5053]
MKKITSFKNGCVLSEIFYIFLFDFSGWKYKNLGAEIRFALWKGCL